MRFAFVKLSALALVASTSAAKPTPELRGAIQLGYGVGHEFASTETFSEVDGSQSSSISCIEPTVRFNRGQSHSQACDAQPDKNVMYVCDTGAKICCNQSSITNPKLGNYGQCHKVWRPDMDEDAAISSESSDKASSDSNFIPDSEMNEEKESYVDNWNDDRGNDDGGFGNDDNRFGNGDNDNGFGSDDNGFSNGRSGRKKLSSAQRRQKKRDARRARNNPNLSKKLEEQNERPRKNQEPKSRGDPCVDPSDPRCGNENFPRDRETKRIARCNRSGISCNHSRLSPEDEPNRRRGFRDIDCLRDCEFDGGRNCDRICAAKTESKLA